MTCFLSCAIVLFSRWLPSIAGTKKTKHMRVTHKSIVFNNRTTPGNDCLIYKQKYFTGIFQASLILGSSQMPSWMLSDTSVPNRGIWSKLIFMHAFEHEAEHSRTWILLSYAKLNWFRHASLYNRISLTKCIHTTVWCIVCNTLQLQQVWHHIKEWLHDGYLACIDASGFPLPF